MKINVKKLEKDFEILLEKSAAIVGNTKEHCMPTIMFLDKKKELTIIAVQCQNRKQFQMAMNACKGATNCMAIMFPISRKINDDVTLFNMFQVFACNSTRQDNNIDQCFVFGINNNGFSSYRRPNGEMPYYLPEFAIENPWL
jgi:hypothetical protein